MTTPRIGDTVHYTAGGNPGEPDDAIPLPTYCCAATITDVYTADGNEDTVDLYVLPRLRLDPIAHPKRTISHDPHDGTPRVATQPTPGTWHHLH